jgi:hypothetical protein
VLGDVPDLEPGNPYEKNSDDKDDYAWRGVGQSSLHLVARVIILLAAVFIPLMLFVVSAFVLTPLALPFFPYDCLLLLAKAFFTFLG